MPNSLTQFHLTHHYVTVEENDPEQLRILSGHGSQKQRWDSNSDLPRLKAHSFYIQQCNHANMKSKVKESLISSKFSS